MWGDLVGSSLLTDKGFERLASELALGLISFEQVRAAGLEAEIGRNLDAARFRKYHDWVEPTWTGFSQHYYDCEKPGCPMWSRLWWRNNDNGTVLMDQQPISFKRKFQHAVYEIIRFLNEVVELLLN